MEGPRPGVRYLFVLPFLALTFMLGPAGLLLYFVVRRFGVPPAGTTS